MTMNQESPEQLPHLQFHREPQERMLALPLCSDWERIAAKVLTHILANLTSGMYLRPEDIIDSLARASEDLSLHFGRSVTLEEMAQHTEIDVDAITEALAAAENDGETIAAEMPPSALLALVGFLQLALKHPGVAEHPYREVLLAFCVQSGERLESIAPGTGRMVELGMPPEPLPHPTAPVMQSEYDMVFD